MVKNMKDWHFSARARNLAMLCRNLEREQRRLLASASYSAAVAWIDAAREMPDDEITVLATDGTDVFTAWHADHVWRECHTAELRQVAHWMDLPDLPNAELSDSRPL